ncbi:MAG TPA: ATP-binding protein [Anaerolineales bacterium]|nr:ATP-binding protein [Anaerolineales bacterium]
MAIEMWGLTGDFYLGLPARLSGYLFLAVVVALLVFLQPFPRRSQGQGRGRSARAAIAFGLLLAFAPLAAEVLVVRLDALGPPATPGLPLESSGAVFSLFGGLPWMLAAGFLGPWPAILVGFAAGIARGGAETLSILTPFLFALQAGFFAWLIRRSYDDWLGQTLRHPLFAGLLCGVLMTVLRSIERYVQSEGTLYDGLNYALAGFGLTFLASALETGIAGAICQVFRETLPYEWHRPMRLEPGPYSRSLAGQMVAVFAVLGFVASALLLSGDWVLARASAQELIVRQMEQTATQLAGPIPFFINAGRQALVDLGREISLAPTDDLAVREKIGSVNRQAPFFVRMVLLDAEGEVRVEAPEGTSTREIPLEVESEFDKLLTSLPTTEFVVPSEQEGGAAQVVFLHLLKDPSGGQVLGALAGWADLQTNPFLAGMVESLQQLSPSEAFLTDENGVVVMHPDPGQTMQTFDFRGAVEGEARPVPAEDGTQRLVFYQPVGGYPWRVVVTMPSREVERLGMRIAVRLFGVIAGVALIVIVVIYGMSNRLTRPLKMMAGAAESIARGNLSQPLPSGGEDEIGRLASSFGRMQRSLKARLDEMDLLLSVSQRMASSFDLSQVLPPILAGVRELTKADLVRLTLAVEAGKDPPASDVYFAGQDPGNWALLDAQIVDLSKARGRFMLENPARAKAVLNLQPLSVPIEALMAMPVRNEDEYVGTLWLGHRSPHAFSSSEVNLLSIVSGQLGVSVANSRLYYRAEGERLRLSAILEATPDAVIVIDRNNRVLLANPAAEMVLRESAEAALGRPAVEVLAPPELLELLVVRGSELRTTEVNLGAGRVLFACATEVDDGEGEPSGRVCVLWDITHYKKLDMLKSEFVATVSHDLRAPLTLMRGYATMISMVGSMNGQQREFVRKILDSADQMARLVDNLLDLGRIEAGVGLKLEMIQIEAVIRDLVKTFRPQAMNKQLTLEIEVGEGMEPIEVDPTLVRQAVANLIDNAIKYTPSKGHVTVRASQAQGRQRISVEDTGVGIAPTDQARLFEKFYRARGKETLRERGSGLGLAIVKSIIEQHGGRVTVESRLGVGSTFTIDLPTHLSAGEYSPLTAGLPGV